MPRPEALLQPIVLLHMDGWIELHITDSPAKGKVNNLLAHDIFLLDHHPDCDVHLLDGHSL